jgi:phosphatidylglycerophosphate synthase
MSLALPGGPAGDVEVGRPVHDRSVEEGTHSEASAARFAGVADRASVVLAFNLLGGLAASLALGSSTPLALVGPLALLFLAWELRAFGGARSKLPNAVTALRAMLTSVIALELPGAALESGWLRAALIGLVFALDGVDGYLARALRSHSLQGARFDMETDGYLVLTLCSLHALAGLGMWVLIGGLLRYVYVLACWLFDKRGEPPRMRFARYAFALSLLTLTLALLVERSAALLLAGLGTTILVASFSRSLLWLFRPDGADQRPVSSA